MAGTKAGGLKAAATNKEKHGKDFYARIGAKGGRNGHTGGFASDPELARLAGAIGGARSTRKGVKNGEGKSRREEAEKVEKQEKPGLSSRIFGGGNGTNK